MKLTLIPGAAALVLLGLAPAPAVAQAQPKPSAYLPATPAVPDAQYALGKQVVELAGISASFERFIPELLREMYGNLTRTRPEIVNDLNAVMKDTIAREFTRRNADMVDYASRQVALNMSEAELKETVAFLKSAAGKKYIEIQPVVMSRVVQAIDVWNRQLAVEVMDRVRAEMKKKGHDL